MVNQESAFAFDMIGAGATKGYRAMRKWIGAVAAIAVFATTGNAWASDTRSAPVPSSNPAVPGWEEFSSAVRDLPGDILAKLPPRLRDDPQIRQEVARLALAAITTKALSVLGGDGDHPQFLPSLNIVLNAGQPNGDTIYKSAHITPGGIYRLRGLRGSSRIVKLGQAGWGPGEAGFGKGSKSLRSYHDFDTLTLDKEGRFDVILSPERPAGYAGDWWKLEAGTANLVLRAVSSDWSRERDPTISIERVDVAAARTRPSADELEARLRELPASSQFLGTLLVDYVDQLVQQGYLHNFKGRGPREGGLAGQYYYESAFDLGDDEALLVEVKAPTQCRYRSLMLTNEIEQAIDWYNNESSLNDAQAAVDGDGILRVVVSARDPAVPNWLDTAGHRRGMIQGRWTDCNAQPIPTARKISLAHIREFLPRDTPIVTAGQRDRIVRERRSQFQLRPLW